MQYFNDDAVYTWIQNLSSRAKVKFAEGLSDCFDDIPVEELLGAEMALEEALEIIVRAYPVSPYDKDKIKDRLQSDGVNLE